MYREPESNWHGHFCPSDFKSDVSTNFTIPAHHRNKLNKTNCGGCRTRTCISFPNGCLVDSSCTDWGNPPKNVEPKISKLPQTVSYRHWKISWMLRSISSNPLFRHKPMWWFSLASLDYCHQRSIAWQFEFNAHWLGPAILNATLPILWASNIHFSRAHSWNRTSIWRLRIACNDRYTIRARLCDCLCHRSLLIQEGPLRVNDWRSAMMCRHICLLIHINVTWAVKMIWHSHLFYRFLQMFIPIRQRTVVVHSRSRFSFIIERHYNIIDMC